MPRGEVLGFLMGIGLPAPLSFRPACNGQSISCTTVDVLVKGAADNLPTLTI